MKQIVILGRGGQGAVTSSQVLAVAAFENGKHSQAFPNFGVERMGAPVKSYCRIDEKPINLRSHVYEADYAIILDQTLAECFDEKVKDGGLIIVNSNRLPKEIPISSKAKIVCVDITKIALGIIGKPFVNIIALGAFSALTKEISLQALEKAVQKQIGSKGSIAEKNIAALKKVYEASK
ncbi:MAG: 2-oxoacid:acceptor oxidoreductase family protein [Candidatus Diapherotrites archaeon]|nr:2-oxoacid:acceptor oxidoreductase family protein [Candidatus Diapherotrites archaeon]